MITHHETMAISHSNQHRQSTLDDEDVNLVAPPTATEDEIAAVITGLATHLHRWRLESTGDVECSVDAWVIAQRGDHRPTADLPQMVKNEERWKMAGRTEKQR